MLYTAYIIIIKSQCTEPSVPEEPSSGASGAERLLMGTESPLFIIATFFSILLSI